MWIIIGKKGLYWVGTRGFPTTFRLHFPIFLEGGGLGCVVLARGGGVKIARLLGTMNGAEKAVLEIF